MLLLLLLLLLFQCVINYEIMNGADDYMTIFEGDCQDTIFINYTCPTYEWVYNMTDLQNGTIFCNSKWPSSRGIIPGCNYVIDWPCTQSYYNPSYEIPILEFKSNEYITKDGPVYNEEFAYFYCSCVGEYINKHTIFIYKTNIDEDDCIGRKKIKGKFLEYDQILGLIEHNVGFGSVFVLIILSVMVFLLFD